MAFYQFLADLVVVAHVTYVAFVVLGLLAILLAVACGWRWGRNFWFRLTHLAMIAVVAGQALAGVLCPLTTLENYFRSKAGEGTFPGSFIGHWAHELIFYDVSSEILTAVYCLFAAAVLATLVLAPPRRPWKDREKDARNQDG